MAKGYISGTVNTPTYESVAYEGKETATAVTSVDNTPSNRTIEVNIKTDFLENTYAAKSDLTSSVNSLEDKIRAEKVRATNVEDNLSTSIDSERSDRQSADDEINNTITAHVDNTNNPHSVTAEQLGLGNVVNTGDSATPTENGVTKFTTGGAFSLKNTLTSAINEETDRAIAAEAQLSNKMVTIEDDQDIHSTKTFVYYMPDDDWIKYETTVGIDRIDIANFNWDTKRSEAHLSTSELTLQNLGSVSATLKSNAAEFNIEVPASDGVNVPVSFNLKDSDSNSYTLIAPYKNGTLSTIEDFEIETSKHQSTSVVVEDAITNINHRGFQHYTATLVTSGNYTFYQILKDGNNPTEEEAKEYMRYMTGSTFLPQYNYDFPKQTIFTFADRSTWKPQYSVADGLRLYRLATSVALDQDVVHKTGDEEIYGEKSFGGTLEFGSYSGEAGGFLSEGSISSSSLNSLNIEAIYNLNLTANSYPGIATSGFSFKDYYKPSGSSTTYISSYKFPNKTAENKSYIIATTDDVPDDSNLVHKGTSSSLSNEDIYGTKKWKSGNIILGDASQDTDHSQVTITKDAISKNAGAGGNAFYLGDNTLKLGYAATETTYKIELNADAIVKKTNPSTTYTYTFPTKTGTIALTSDCGTKLYKHAISFTGVTGALTLYTTGDEKFTTVNEIANCVGYSNFKNGIFLHGKFDGPSSLLTILCVNAGAVVGINYSNAISTISLVSATAMTDTVTAL